MIFYFNLTGELTSAKNIIKFKGYYSIFGFEAITESVLFVIKSIDLDFMNLKAGFTVSGNHPNK